MAFGMDSDAIPSEYVLLGLRAGRIINGLVDAFTGEKAIRRRIDAEPRPDADQLVARIASLRSRLPAAKLPERRTVFLERQLVALECVMRRRTGHSPAFRAELTDYFDVTVQPGDPDRYRAVHTELAELLPGGGPLAARMAAYRKREEVPAERLGPAVQALSGALRERTGALGLPAGESVRYELTRDRPWNAFNEYLGDYRSRVLVNADSAGRASALASLVAHEAYPGHHAERCLREAGPVRRDGQREQSVFLVNSPQALIAEGMAEQALFAAVGPGWGLWAQDVLGERGIALDGELAERVEGAYAGLAGVRQDAALMLHELAAEPDEVVAYLRRWLLVGEARARRLLSFLAHPLWRAYSTTYAEGGALVRAWLDARPAGEPILTRYRRLAEEPFTPGLLRAELG